MDKKEQKINKAINEERSRLDKQYENYQKRLRKGPSKKYRERINALKENLTEEDRKRIKKKMDTFFSKQPKISWEDKFINRFIGKIEARLGKKLEKRFKELVKQEVDKMDDKFGRYVGTLYEDFESKQALMAENILDVREKIAALVEMVEKNTEDIDTIKLNVELIRKDLKTKIEREEFLALEKRVFALEQKEHKRVKY